MTAVRILTERELRSCIALDTAVVDIVAEAFVALAEGRVVMPPILRLDVPEHNGEVDVKTAYIRGLDGFAMKTSPGFFDNPKRGLPSTSGLMVVHDARTGFVRAVLLDNGYLTDVRTAAAGAVAARALAPQGPVRAGILGAGMQARLQLKALSLVRPVTEVRIWARDGENAKSYAKEMADALGVAVGVAPTAEAVVRDSDVVVTTTPAKAPLIMADWLHPRLHITAMGSDAEDKTELEPLVLAECDRFVCDRRAQSERLGEMHHALLAGVMTTCSEVSELGEVLTGRKPGRGGDDDVTVCDLTGTGAQDTVIALHALSLAEQRDLGTAIEP